MKKVCFLNCTLLFLMALMASDTFAAIVITPVHDARIRNVFHAGGGMAEYDLTGYLEAYQDPAGSGFVTRSAMEFDISVIAPASTITGLSISLTQIFDNQDGAEGPFRLYGYIGNGRIEALDVQRTFSLIGNFSASSQAQAGTVYNVSLSEAFLQGLVNSQEHYLGVVLLGSGPGGLSFESMEQHYGYTGPRLSVTLAPVPLPSALWPALMGIAALAAGRRFKNRK